ncbi:hypothetical protein EV182_004002, partial [Spiromyces aspiralis]
MLLNRVEQLARIGPIRSAKLVEWDPSSKTTGIKAQFNYYNKAILGSTEERGAVLEPGDRALDFYSISVGDHVLVADPHCASSTLAHTPVRIVRVISMFDNPRTGKMYFHGRLLLPGRDTIIEEVANANELFAVDVCSNYSFPRHFAGKVIVEKIGHERSDQLSLYGEIPAGQKRLFYRFWYDLDSGAFEDVDLHTECSSPQFECPSCEANDAKASVADGLVLWKSYAGRETPVDGESKPSRRAWTATYKGIEYHNHDFCYIIPKDPGKPYELGYIIGLGHKDHVPGLNDRRTRCFNPPGRVDPLHFGQSQQASLPTRQSTSVAARTKIRVQVLRRMVDLPREARPETHNSRAYDDDRQLYWTTKTRYISMDRLEGKFWVEHSSQVKNGDLDYYKDQDEHAFYADYCARINKVLPCSADDFIYVTCSDSEDADTYPVPAACKLCRAQREDALARLEGYLRTSERGAAPSGHPLHGSLTKGQVPLRAMDIFSGCGGLTEGMEQTGVIETRWAIEYMPSAAKSFAQNHPVCKVYNQCTNLLLERAIAQHTRNEVLRPLMDIPNEELVPDMPAPGEVDFIYCGPPCQGFSRVNRFPKADDIKTSMIANSLSYVDFYRPSYFLLENVRGLLQYRLGGVQAGRTKIDGGIKMGMLKFILRSLTSMGYQTRFGLLQAANYGLAQSRRRLFVWASKRGCALPSYPQPITCFSGKGSLSIPLPNGIMYCVNTRTDNCAPHPRVTVGNAISDLPAFEYRNPAKEYPDPYGGKPRPGIRLLEA